ncbi:MAG: hypothetical protein COA79_12425 [Planctomycetota bacterium]|nr:MAG: hypothetical protein COA79_12425 [Planctomycetota bacterium]
MNNISSIILSIFLLFISTFLFAGNKKSVLSKTIKSMKAGEWKKFESKGFSKELLYSSNKTILPYANKAGWDAKTQTIHFIGMCHMTPPMKHITYSSKSNSWKAQPPEDFYKTSKWFHAYDNSTAGKGIYYHNFWGSSVWQFDIAKKTWAQLPKVIKKGSHGASLSFFPEMGTKGSLIHLFGRNGIQIFDLTTKKWRLSKSNPTTIGPYHNVSMYNAKRKTVILGGGNGCNFLYELNPKGQLTQTKEAPFPIGVNSSTFVIDPASGDLLIFSKKLGFYYLNLTKIDSDWKKIEGKKGLSGVVISLENLGATMWFNLSGTFLYKHK